VGSKFHSFQDTDYTIFKAAV